MMVYGILMRKIKSVNNMSVDVEIYLNNIIRFFKQNPQDLLNLVPEENEQEFYDKLREVAFKNYNKIGEANLTQSQIIKICEELISKKTIQEEVRKLFGKTSFGYYGLN